MTFFQCDSKSQAITKIKDELEFFHIVEKRRVLIFWLIDMTCTQSHSKSIHRLSSEETWGLTDMHLPTSLADQLCHLGTTSQDGPNESEMTKSHE